MPRVVHFEIAADNPARAVKFYETVFGWKFSKWEGPIEYWLVETGPQDQPGIDGGLMQREQPESGTVNVIDVTSVDDAVDGIQAAGGAIVVPKFAVPGVGWAAYFKDPEGNVMGVMQSDPAAA